MSKKHHPNHQIQITDLIGDAVENAIARREQNLTPEEAKQIKGAVTAGGLTTCGMQCHPDELIDELIKQRKFQ